jgi:dynein light intermediate chain
MAMYEVSDFNRPLASKGDGPMGNLPRPSLVEFLDPEPVTNGQKQGGNTRISKRDKKALQVQEVLNSILPPREFVDSFSEQRFKQAVSTVPASRHDVVKLQVKLDEQLQERQARENGICPVREELYSQCFDELIRQVALNSQERGLLLMRVRDEVRMTIAAYQTLYHSSITFGMRKALQAEQGSTELSKKLVSLEDEKKKLQSLLQDQRGLYDAVEKRIAEQRQVEEKKMKDEKEFLTYQGNHLEAFLKSAMAT